MTDLETTLTHHLARRAAAAAPRPDRSAVMSETKLVSLRAVAPWRRSRRRLLAFAVAAMVAVSTPVVVWRARDTAGDAPFASMLRGVECRVYVRPEASEEAIERIGNALRPRRDVRDLQLTTQQMAYEEFRRLFANKPDILEFANPFMLPASWRFDLLYRDHSAISSFTEEVERDPSIQGASCAAP
jgi:hypothetical protein